ncbi:MAG: thiamine biosynthesis protein [Desulfurivibrio sp.]|nr:thiamine biosynthesis protein [Desulfurivibrio sp.]
MTTALALFSGGLDSTLACRVVMEQGIKVVAVKFVSPFFGAELLAAPEAYRQKVRHQYGIDVVLREVTQPYLRMLAAPAHGYGKNFNPCVDCKILLMREALDMLPEFGASFLVSGEVLGQRPMSQRRDTLRVIERDSGCADLLLRPLSALNLPPTRPEREGLVDRQRLHAFKGRNRTPQIELAARFGIEDYQSPGGGCVLTDPNQAKRIQWLYREVGAQGRTPAAEDIRLLLAGRVFCLPGGAWAVLGRNQAGNEQLQKRRGPGDWQLTLRDHPGPLAILRHLTGEDDLPAAAGLVLRYAAPKTRAAGPAVVTAEGPEQSREITATPIADEVLATWRR